MFFLIIVSLVWAFSFSLIKTYLAGLDSNFIAFIRLLISLIVFLPFLQLKNLTRRIQFKLILTGMIQYGLMYLFYIYSFHFLKAYEVALFTIFTPFFVILINDFLEKKFHPLFFISVFIAVSGTFVIIFTKISDSPFLTGFLLVQASNLSFAFGQVYYKRILNPLPEIKDHQIFGLLFLGAAIISAFPAGISFQPQTFHLSLAQMIVLIYLGAVASGICFFLWNMGARKVNAGTLGIFNNLKIPLAVFASVLIFGENPQWLRLICGFSLIILSLLMNEWLSGKRKSHKDANKPS